MIRKLYIIIYKKRKAIPIFYLISTILGLFGLLMLSSFIIIVLGIIYVFKVKFFAFLDDKTLNYFDLEDISSSYIVLVILISITKLGHGLPLLWNPSKIFLIIRSLPAFIFYSPSYIHLFVIYSFCRIDDLSWGTKGLDNSTEGNK